MWIKKILKYNFNVNKSDTFKSILQALFFAILIRTFLFQPSVIPSGSMIPTLLVGDYIIVNKFSYGYSKYSFPFSYDFFSGRIFGSQPRRGDVVVFRLPKDPTVDYVKRVIGLPGDKISLKQGAIYINDIPVARHAVGYLSYHYKEDWSNNIPIFQEKLDSGITYNVLSENILSSSNNISDFFVPKGHYFMMGDNRDKSKDSRWFDVGFIPEENLIGRASIVLFSIGDDTPFAKVWLWISNMRWNRFFKIL
ncbi:signal peptidase I [Candidatus Liberibacter africanus]|uniref:Signal peptidase I n=1 Tax=Candidatus Liberibacter africanus PTSAPSY TaxID=1277257 RepID=A0A0G3IA26_LIBAF|nr:signal peptidase I [Candidatus Liberibacter africanus]AKK20677.1 type I signal peptidase [Candidatus Liberibacter africanus PTSAPSY]QTP64344.1 signal peptidase I [Candidatus Liberibacter africanus]